MADVKTKVITPKAILSYPHLHEPQPGMNGGKAKYSAALVFPAGTDLKALAEAVAAAAEAKWPGKAQKMLQSGALKSPFRKGEEKEYAAGSVFINVRTETKPGVVSAQADPATGKPAAIPADKIRTELYPGCYVRASVTAFAFDNSGNKGVSFALNNIQKLGDGDRLDGRVAAENEFDVDLSQPPSDIAHLI